MTTSTKKSNPRPVRKSSASDDAATGPTKVFPAEQVIEQRRVTFFDNMTTEERVRVYREDDRTKRMVFHGILASDEANEERVSEKFGGGKYRVQLMTRSETGQDVVTKSYDFQLPGPYRPMMGELPGVSSPVQPNGQSVGMVGTVNAGSGTRELLESAMASKFLDLMKASSGGASVDWAPIIASVTTLMGTVITGMLNRKQGADPAMMEMIGELRRELASLKSQPGPAQSAMSDAVKGIKELLDVADMVKGGRGDDNGNSQEGQMLSMGSKLLEAIMNRGTPNAMPAQGALPSGQPDPVAALPLWHQWLLHYRQQLTTAATRGTDVGWLAELVANMLPSDEEGILVEFLRMENAEVLTYQVIPELASFPKWTADLLTALRTEILATEEEGDGEG